MSALSFPLHLIAQTASRDNFKQTQILRRLRDCRLPYQNEFLISNNQYSRRWLFAVNSSIKDHKYLTVFFLYVFVDIVNPLLLKCNQANQILLIMNWTITAIPANLEPHICKVHAQHAIYRVLLSPTGIGYFYWANDTGACFICSVRPALWVSFISKRLK